MNFLGFYTPSLRAVGFILLPSGYANRKELNMKRLLGLLLVIGMVGCGGGKIVDRSKLVNRDGLMYEGDSETPFTGVVVAKHENGQKASETTFKDGKPEGLATIWHKNGQKRSEDAFKDGKREGPTTMWYDNGQKWEEANYKDGKPAGPYTSWHKNGQKQSEATFKDGKLVSETKWDEEGNEIKK